MADAAEPTGYTIDGTPWEEPRPPHLPDPLTGSARRVPAAAWIFIAVAVALLVWDLRDIATVWKDGSTLGVLSLLSGTIPAVATCLFGAALFIRHPSARRTDPLIVFGIALLVIGTCWPVLRTILTAVFSSSDQDGAPFSFTPLGVEIGIFVGFLLAIGVVYVARGLLDARARDDDSGVRRRSLILVATVAVILITYLSQTYRYWTDGSVDQTDPWVIVEIVSSLLVGVIGLLAWAYLAATSWTGSASGERPPRAWQFAAWGAGLLVLKLLLTSVWYWVLTINPPTDSTNELLFWPYRVIGYITALGYVLLLVAFALGLPGIDELATDEAAEAPGPAPAEPAGAEPADAEPAEAAEARGRRACRARGAPRIPWTPSPRTPSLGGRARPCRARPRRGLKPPRQHAAWPGTRRVVTG